MEMRSPFGFTSFDKFGEQEKLLGLYIYYLHRHTRKESILWYTQKVHYHHHITVYTPFSTTYLLVYYSQAVKDFFPMCCNEYI